MTVIKNHQHMDTILQGTILNVHIVKSVGRIVTRLTILSCSLYGQVLYTPSVEYTRTRGAAPSSTLPELHYTENTKSIIFTLNNYCFCC